MSARLRALTADLPPLYWLLWTGTLVNRLGTFVVPFLIIYLTGQRGIAVAQAATVVSLFGLGSFVAQLVAGELADRFGRRPVLLLSLFSTPVMMMVLGLARSVPLITASTLIVGFCTDLYRPASAAAIADLVPSHARLRAYGYNYWAVNVGAAIAPVMAGDLAHIDYLLLFVGDALTTLAFVFGIISMQSYTTLPAAMQTRGLGPQQYGLAIALNGALVVLLSIPFNHAAGRWPRFRLMAMAGVLLGTGFGLYALASSLALYAAGVAIWTLGEIGSAAAAPAIIADLAPSDKRGVYQGVFHSGYSLAFFAGPMLGGWVYQHAGARPLWLGCFALGLALAVAYAAMGRVVTRRDGPAGRPPSRPDTPA